MSDKNVVGISFGVLGKGSISGDSGARILKQLKEIVGKINANPNRFKVKLGVDENHFKKQISALAKKINAQTSNIKISNNIGVKTGTNTQKTAHKEKISTNKAIITLLKEQYAEENRLLMARKHGNDAMRLQLLTAQEATQKFEEAFENAKKSGGINANEIKQIQELNAKLSKQFLLKQKIAEHQDLGLETKFKGAQAAASALLNRYQDLIKHNKEAAVWADKLYEKIGQTFSGSADQVREFVNLTRDADTSLNQLTVSTSTFGSKLRQMFDRRVFITLSVLLVGTLMRAFRQVYQNVVELDTAMTNLRMSARATKREFDDFSRSVSQSARSVGASVSELVEAVTVFTRLGHSLGQAQNLAEQAIIYSRITGESIDDIATVMSSAIKEFNLSTNDLESVFDQFIHIGQNFAITSEQISRALNDAAQSLALSGNTLSESLGILGAATSALQNESSAATAINHISARLSRNQSQLRVLGIDENSVIETERLASRMDNLGISIRDVNGNFRSTFAVLNDVSNAWENLNDSQRNAIATMIAGDSQATAFKSIIENWQQAQDIVEGYSSGIGNMRRVQEEYMNSIEGRLSQLRATWVDFSQTLLDSSFVKVFLGIIKGIAEILSAIMSVGDGFLVSAMLAATAIAVVVMAYGKLGTVLEKVKTAYQNKTLLVFKSEAALQKEAATILANAKAQGIQMTQTEALTIAKKNARLATISLTAATAMLTIAFITIRNGGQRWARVLGILAGVLGIAAFAVRIFFLKTRLGIKGVDKTIRAFMASNPIGWILLLVSAIVTATMALVNLFRRPSVADLQDAAREAKNAVNELKEEIEDVNSKLEDTAERIREIEELSRQRPLNLVEEDELNRLRALNSELVATQRELEIRKNAAQSVAQNTATIAANAQLDQREQASREMRNRDNRHIYDDTGNRIDLRSEVLASGRQSRSNLERIDIIMDNWGRANATQRAFVAEVIGDLAENAEAIRYVAGAVNTEQQAANEAYRRIWEQRDRFVIASGGGLSDIWGSLLTRSNFSNAANELRIFADAGEVTAQSLEELARSNSQIQSFISYIESLGYTLRDHNGFIDSFIVSINELWSSSLFRVGRLDHLDIIEETQGSFDALARGLDDVFRVGVLSAQRTRLLIEEYEHLAKFFSRTSQGFVLSDEFSGLTQSEILQAFATESLKQYVAALEIARRQVADTAGEHVQYSRAWHEHQRAIKTAYNAYSNLNIATETWAIHIRSVAIRDATDALNDKRDALRDQLSAYRDLINIRRDLLRTYRQEINFQRELARRQQNLADIQAQLTLSRMDNSASGRARTRELESRLREAQEALDDFTLERAVDVLTRQLDNQFREYELLINAEIDRIVEEIANLADMLKVIIDRPATDTAGVENQVAIIGKQGQLDALNRRIEQQDTRLNDARLQETIAQQNLADALSDKHGDVESAEYLLSQAEEAMRKAIAEMNELEAKRTGLENKLNSLRTEPAGSVDASALQRNSLQAQIDAARADAQRQTIVVNSARASANDAQSFVDNATKHDDVDALERDRDAANRVYSSAQADLSNLNAHLRELEKRMQNLPKFHTGGVINTNRSVPGMKNDELLAILQNGEGVLTRHHMRNLSHLIDTNKFLLKGGTGSTNTDINNFNFEFNVGAVTRESLPQTEKIINEAVNRFKEEIGSGMVRSGYKNSINKFRQ